MNDFTFNPVRVHFGQNALAKLPEELAGVGKTVLLVCGGGCIKRSGLYGRVTAMPLAAGKEIVELPGVMPNPRTEKVYEAIPAAPDLYRMRAYLFRSYDPKKVRPAASCQTWRLAAGSCFLFAKCASVVNRKEIQM